MYAMEKACIMISSKQLVRLHGYFTCSLFIVLALVSNSPRCWLVKHADANANCRLSGFDPDIMSDAADYNHKRVFKLERYE